jgi:hypothetical protein
MHVALTRPVAHSRIEGRSDDGDVEKLRGGRKTFDMFQVSKAPNAIESPLDARQSRLHKL